MKKKIRHITVNNQKYNWRVTRIDPHYVLVKIWIDGLKKLPWIEVKFPFEDLWLNFADLVEKNNGYYDASEDNLLEGITPKKVSLIIEAVIRDKGLPFEIEKPIVLDWCVKTSSPSYDSCC